MALTHNPDIKIHNTPPTEPAQRPIYYIFQSIFMLVLFPKPLDGCFKLPLGVLHGYLLSISKSVCRTEFTYNSYSACVHPVGEGSIPTLGLCRCWTPHTGLVRLTAVHLSRTHTAAGRRTQHDTWGSSWEESG